MDLIDQMKELSSGISKRSERLETEEATKTARIMPFIKALGYDVFNPEEVVPEFTCDVGTKKGEKVDYAIMKDGNPIMIFECKSANMNLEKEHASQLYRYFSVTEVKVGVLTNGIIYKFYSDLEKANTMDAKPFLELDMLNIKEPLVEELKRFRKESFKTDEIVSAASELKYTKEIKRILGEELDSPSEAFIKFFTKQVYSGMIRKTAREKFTGIVHHAFKEFINDEISDRLEKALERGSGTQEVIHDDKNAEEGNDDGIVTTEEEIEGFHIVRAILCETIDPERVVLKDWKRYCNVLFDGKATKQICRFYFNNPKQIYVSFFDENKKEEKVPIDKLSEIYNHAEKLKATVGYYDGKISSKAPSDSSEKSTMGA
ncbi:MAG: type I restriction endonuclease [Halobacteriota archaeon]